MKDYPYQLVLQFPEKFFPSFDALIEFEEKLIAALEKSHRVDGHDVGAGTVNFFVHTQSPPAAFKAFRKYLGTNKVEKHLRVAFRLLPGDRFTVLWPKRFSGEFNYVYPRSQPKSRSSQT